MSTGVPWLAIRWRLILVRAIVKPPMVLVTTLVTPLLERTIFHVMVVPQAIDLNGFATLRRRVAYQRTWI